MVSTVEVIGRTIRNELLQPADPDEPVARDWLQTAQAVLFELGKAGIRVVEPGDVLDEKRFDESPVYGGPVVRLVLRVE